MAIEALVRIIVSGGDADCAVELLMRNVKVKRIRCLDVLYHQKRQDGMVYQTLESRVRLSDDGQMAHPETKITFCPSIRLTCDQDAVAGECR